jgi:predicted nucleic acid-binding protein
MTTLRMAELIVKCSDLPMDFTDAALVVGCERLEIPSVFTFDKDFSVYRPAHARGFETIP